MHKPVDSSLSPLRQRGRAGEGALALRRIPSRVRLGGHNVPRADVVRRFSRSWDNFVSAYLPLADAWIVLDNSGAHPRFLEQGP